MQRLYLLLLAACAADEKNLPVNPGGCSTCTRPDGSRRIDGGRDAAADASVDAPPNLAGRVCVVASLLTNECASSGAGGIQVAFGTITGTTLGDGSYTLSSNPVSSAFGVATGTAIRAAAGQNGARTIYAVTQNYWDSVVLRSDVLPGSANGIAVAVRFRQNGIPVVGVAAVLDPPVVDPIRYDTADDTVFAGEATGPAGVSLHTGIASATTFAIIDAVQTATTWHLEVRTSTGALSIIDAEPDVAPQ